MLSVTHSSIETFRTCHRKYQLEYDKLLRAKDTPWALLDGTALHMGLESLYRGRLEIDEKVGWNGINAQEIDELYEKEKGGEDESAVCIHKGTVMGMLQGYVLAYAADEFKEFKPEVQGEIAFLNSISGQRVQLLFKTDAMVRTQNDSPYLFETKTTSASDMARFLSNLGIDDQPDTYLYCTRKLGMPFLGVIYNVIRKPKLRQSDKEIDENFVKRLQKALIEDAAKPVEERKYYFRETIYKSEADLKKFEVELEQVTADICGYMDYRSPKRCNDLYGGNCPFLPLCSGSDCQGLYVHKDKRHTEYIPEKK